MIALFFLFVIPTIIIVAVICSLPTLGSGTARTNTGRSWQAFWLTREVEKAEKHIARREAVQAEADEMLEKRAKQRAKRLAAKS